MNPIQAVLDSGASAVVIVPLFLSILTVIVLVHELGHYALARRFGVGVHTFAIGLPPRLWSRLQDADPVPAVALPGCGRQRVDGIVRLARADAHDSSKLRGCVLLYRHPELPTRTDLQIAREAGAAGAILATATSAIDHLVDQDAQALPTFQVDAVVGDSIATRARDHDLQAELRCDQSPGNLSGNASIHLGGTRFAINALPLGGYVRMAGESENFESPHGFSQRRPWQRALILFAGPAMNFLLASTLFTIAALFSDEVSASIAEVEIASPAEQAGLMADDRIVSISNVEISGVRGVIEVLRASAGREISIEILRGGTSRTIRATPRIRPPLEQGALGIRVRPVLEPAPLPLAIARGFERTVGALGLFPMAIGEWISGNDTVQLSGPVGIATIVDKAARQGIESVLFVGGFLSAQIGLINLVPWPGLDGGRLAFVGFEWLTGRRLNPRREAAFHFVGIMLLLTLAVFVTIGDVQRLASP